MNVKKILVRCFPHEKLTYYRPRWRGDSLASGPDKSQFFTYILGWPRRKINYPPGEYLFHFLQSVTCTGN